MYLDNKLLELLKIELTEIHQGFKKASIEGKGTPQEVSDRREQIVQRFFEKYYPFPFRITKGNIIDSFGNSSNSIDCVILDPSHPYTIDSTNNRPSILFADGVDFAIEIKGCLKSKDEVTRAANQLISVKNLQRVNCGVYIDDLRTPFHFKIPCVLFVHETYTNIESLLDEIISYYYEMKVKRLNQFDLLVTSSCVIMNSHPDTINYNNYEGLILCESNDYTLGVMLYWMSLFPLVQPQFSDDVISHYLKIDLSARKLRKYEPMLTEIRNSTESI